MLFCCPETHFGSGLAACGHRFRHCPHRAEGKRAACCEVLRACCVRAASDTLFGYSGRRRRGLFLLCLFLTTKPWRWQIENEKFQLFFLLMHVPATVVKSLARIAERGYDRMQQQIASETTGADDFDCDNGLDDTPDVRPGWHQCVTA